MKGSAIAWLCVQFGEIVLTWTLAQIAAVVIDRADSAVAESGSANPDFRRQFFETWVWTL